MNLKSHRLKVQMGTSFQGEDWRKVVFDKHRLTRGYEDREGKGKGRSYIFFKPKKILGGASIEIRIAYERGGRST